MSAVLFPRGARVRSVPQCYFDRVPDKLIWTCWPMFGYFGRLFFLDRSIRTPKGVLRTKLYLGFLGLYLEFGGNLAPKSGPHRQSRRLLAARIELLFYPFLFSFRLTYITSISTRSDPIYTSICTFPCRCGCARVRWAVSGRRIRENNAIRELMDDVPMNRQSGIAQLGTRPNPGYLL